MLSRKIHKATKLYKNNSTIITLMSVFLLVGCSNNISKHKNSSEDLDLGYADEIGSDNSNEVVKSREKYAKHFESLVDDFYIDEVNTVGDMFDEYNEDYDYVEPLYEEITTIDHDNFDMVDKYPEFDPYAPFVYNKNLEENTKKHIYKGNVDKEITDKEFIYFVNSLDTYSDFIDSSFYDTNTARVYIKLVNTKSDYEMDLLISKLEYLIDKANRSMNNRKYNVAIEAVMTKKLDGSYGREVYLEDLTN